MNIYGAYLEDYHFIKVIVPKNINYISIKLIGKNIDTFLNIFKDETYSHERHLYTSFLGYIKLHLDYQVVITTKHEEISYHLNLGKITRTKRFDLENYTDIPLGAIYRKEQTTFRVWSPVAKEIKLNLNNTLYDMEYLEKGVWEKVVKEDVLNQKYFYEVRVNEEFIKTLDPYAYSNTPNFKESIVVDLNKAYKMKHDYINNRDLMIEEISIKDITSLKQGGTFADLTATKDLSYGLGYLKNIGFKYLQFMPVCTFGAVDEIKKDDYNWGYNPLSYFSISNFLTKDFNNPLGGINELKELIDTVHSLNMGVTLDVVYNHVFDANTFPYSILVPGYCYHTLDNGFLTNSSGCGNDLNSTKLMVQRLILDSLVYLKKEFKVDGFRFDLMDLIDVNTLNKASSMLNEIDKFNVLYGEGWDIPMKLPKELGGLCENFFQLPTYSFFNDSFRNLLKSNFDCTSGGYVLGQKVSNNDLYNALTGYCVNEEKWSSAKFSINYIECHDNYTLYDTIIKLNPNITKDELKDRLILGLSLITLSQGIPFYHLGMEFGRTKLLHHNSYNLSDKYNGVNFDNLDEFEDVIIALKNLILLRDKLDIFKMTDPNDILNNIKLEKFDGSCIIRYYDKTKNDTYMLIVKNDYVEEQKVFAPGTTLIFNGKVITEEDIELFKFNTPGVYLFKK